MKIKIAITDDHPLVISGLHHIISTHPEMTVVTSYANGQELLTGLTASVPDVLLLDIQMPGQTGDELAEIILSTYPSVRIIALTNQDDLYYINKLLSSGVAGYILKTTSAEVLLNAITTVHQGGEYIDAAIKEKLVLQAQHEERIRHETPVLSKREKQVLEYVAANLTSQQIADALFLSKRTVDNHRQSLLLKLGAKNGVSLVRRAIELGLLD